MDMDGIIDDIAEAVAEIGRIDAVPNLLEVLCEITGMRFAMVARVTGKTWMVCAVQDGLHLRIKVGEPLALRTNLAMESQTSRTPIVIEQASFDPRYSNQNGPKLYQIESYVSVPIFLSSGCYFGTLCAFDPRPAKVREPYVVSTFKRFAALIASQLDQQALQKREHTALLDERAAAALREQFIAILGHDLRNPLQAVYASGDLLERKLTDPELAGIAARIKTNVRRMSSLIDDVLDFARGRLGGGIEVEVTDVENIHTGLATVIQEFKDAQPDSTIISNISVDRPVRCDLGRLQQIASNLLANALTHGLPHSPIKITARADETDLVLEVWNAGKPIPTESLGKIFEPFWRHSVSAGRHGLGLGLHICSQIVRAHDGRMSVTSTGDSGTQFTARLPLFGGLPKTSCSVAEAPRAAAADAQSQRTDLHRVRSHSPLLGLRSN
jgi:signal transduction histidine kinase